VKKTISILSLAAVLILAASMAAQANLITNPGFEDGLTGWDASFNVVTRNQHLGVLPFEGNSMAVLPILGILDASMNQDIVNNTPYTLAEISFAYNIQVLDFSILPDFGLDSFSVLFNDDEILSIPLDDSFGDGSSILGWMTFSATASVPPMNGLFTFRFCPENFPPGGGDPFQSLIVYLDAVSVQAVPIPPSLLILSSGLIGIFWVKRSQLLKSFTSLNS